MTASAELLERNHGAAAHEPTFVPVAVDSIVPRSALDFDMFLRVGRSHEFQLYRSREYSIEAADLERLKSRGVRTLFIAFEDRDKYAEYLKARLSGDEQISSVQRFSMLQASAHSILDESMSNNAMRIDVGAINELGANLVEAVCGEHFLLREMFGLMAHDYCTYTHVINVCTFSLVIARKLGKSDEAELARIATGALLHDVGKRHISTAILNKPGRLNDREKAAMRLHPQLGFEDVCMQSDLTWGQLMMIYQHHEREDGRGYPVGIAADEIHPWAKICAVADVLDALTAERPYKKRESLGAALDFFQRHAGRAFDREAVACLVSAMSKN